MKKLILSLLILFASVSFGQFKTALQFSAAIPTGYNEDAVEIGYGGNLNLAYETGLLNSELTLNFGYFHFGHKKDLPDYKFSYSSIPILAGLRINLGSEDMIPYLGVSGGLYISEYTLDIDYGYFGKEVVVTKENHWGFSPEFGFKMLITNDFSVDVNARYNRINTKYIARAYLLIQSGFTYKF